MVTIFITRKERNKLLQNIAGDPAAPAGKWAK
jgi:hypothetical protein